jgi:hypothetical protein
MAEDRGHLIRPAPDCGHSFQQYNLVLGHLLLKEKASMGSKYI